jgi:hypothetical protein
MVNITEGTKFVATYSNSLNGSLYYYTSWSNSQFGPGTVVNYTGGNQYNMATLGHTLQAGDYILQDVTQGGVHYYSRIYPTSLGGDTPQLVEPVWQSNGTVNVQFGYSTGPGTIAVYYRGTDTLAAPISHSPTIYLPGPGDYTYYHTTAFLSSVNATDPAVLAYRSNHRLGMPFLTSP